MPLDIQKVHVCVLVIIVSKRGIYKNDLLGIIDGPENRFSVVQKVFEKSR